MSVLNPSPSQSLEALAQFGADLAGLRQMAEDPALANLSEARKIVVFAGENVEKLSALTGDLSTAERAIRASSDFSPSGRANRLGALSREYSERLDRLNIPTFLARARERLSLEERAIGDGTTDAGLSLVERLALRDAILDTLATTTDALVVGAEIRRVIEDAISSGDNRVPACLLDLPGVLVDVVLDPGDAAELRQQWLEARSPGQARVIELLRRAIAAVETRSRAVRAEISVVGGGEGDELAKLAAGDESVDAA